jgi:uncharacterized protein YndB with AHSA1/START domain
MKWAIRVVVVVAVLVGLMAAAGWMLPVGHEASSSAEIERPAAEIYALVSDVAGYPRWWSEIARVEMLEAAAPDRPRFREHMSTGPVVMVVEEAVPPSRFVTRIDDPDQPFGGTWTFVLEPLADRRTRVTITERGEVYNPIFRFLARVVFGYTGTMESCLAALAAAK